jgi:hypothetical protein
MWAFAITWRPSSVNLSHDTKGVIRICKSKKNRQYNDQKKKYKRTNNDKKKTTIHIKLTILFWYINIPEFAYVIFGLTLPKAMWAFAITWRPSSVNLSHFNLLLWNPSAKWTVDASYQFSINLQLAKRFQRRRLFRNQPFRNRNCLWRPCLLMNRNLVGSIYGRFCIKFPQSRMKGERHRLSPPRL